jgi:hypothetical protein
VKVSFMSQLNFRYTKIGKNFSLVNCTCTRDLRFPQLWTLWHVKLCNLISSYHYPEHLGFLMDMWVTIHHTGIMSQKSTVCTCVSVQFLIFIGVPQKWCFNTFWSKLKLQFTTRYISRMFSAWSSCWCIVECIHVDFVSSKLLALREWSGWLWC